MRSTLGEASPGRRNDAGQWISCVLLLCVLECLPWTDAAKVERSAKARKVARIPVCMFLNLMKRKNRDNFYTFIKERRVDLDSWRLGRMTEV